MKPRRGKKARNPIRRSRNIGTSKQGRGRDNRMVIPDSWHDDRIFWEKLTSHTTVHRVIHGKTIPFLVESTRQDSVYPCTVDDVAKMLSFVPVDDLEGLEVFVLRQPKRKEQILRLVWGRLVYFAQYGQVGGPAIILEAIQPHKNMAWSRSLTPDDLEELERLRADGFQIDTTKREYLIHVSLESARNTMLYRTLPHEIGHWVHYLSRVERPASDAQNPCEAQDRFDKAYDRMPILEKEAFAHQYADKLQKRLTKIHSVPFARILDFVSLEKEGLRKEDFV